VDECLVDLAELRGYQYHNGMVFAAYVDGASDAVARGGRYDGIGAVFGRPRDATGFSLDLRGLAPHLPATEVNDPILAPARDDPDLARAITRLRNRGEIVIVDLPGHARSRRELGCGRQLVRSRGRWVVQTGIGPAVRGTAT
jgi:ATP phosphoribosyltransferase regulatory subunit